MKEDLKPEARLDYTVVIPVLNGGNRLRQLLLALANQSWPPDAIILIDSGSTDGSLDDPLPTVARVVALEGAFNHGAVRNQGAGLARTPYLVFMTQDAVPSRDALERLLRPIALGDAEATYARQVPRSDANPLERFARAYNYPVAGSVPIREAAVRRAFFSNACSAVSRSAFEALGGFPTHTIMNEDMLFAHRLQRAGYRVAYVPEAEVEHSHDYSSLATFRRYFDIGVFLSQASEELSRLRLSGEGARYAAGLFTSLLASRQYDLLPAALAETTSKAVGIFLGKRHNLLPLRIKRRLSMHKAFWR